MIYWIFRYINSIFDICSFVVLGVWSWSRLVCLYVMQFISPKYKLHLKTSLPFSIISNSTVCVKGKLINKFQLNHSLLTSENKHLEEGWVFFHLSRSLPDHLYIVFEFFFFKVVLVPCDISHHLCCRPCTCFWFCSRICFCQFGFSVRCFCYHPWICPSLRPQRPDNIDKRHLSPPPFLVNWAD